MLSSRSAFNLKSLPGKEVVMLGRFGWPELLVVLLIALLVFGPGRVKKLGEELGQGIRSFQEGLKGEDSPADEDTGASDGAQ